MATVIERLVIQGCNPRAPPQPTRCSSKPYRQAKAPAATPIAVTPLTPKQSRPSSALTISGRSTGPLSSAPTAPHSAGTVRKLADSTMQPAALPASGTSPIVRKMEYLALVRQARHGMSTGDAATCKSSGTSRTNGDPFVIEGRTVASRISSASCHSSISCRQGHKKSQFTSSIGTPDAFIYSDSDISSIGENPEGHGDQFQITQRHQGGRAGSIRSVHSDSSNRSLQLPTLTRGSSEPGVSGSTPIWKHKQGRWTLDSDCDELTAVANHLLLVRQQFKLATAAPERNRTTKPATPRSAYSGCRAEELRSCLSVSAQPMVESGELNTQRDGHRWTSPKHRLAQNPLNRPGKQTEGGLLYKRHKWMEKITKGASTTPKYTFNSVSSYLNFNKLNVPSATSPSLVADHSMLQPEIAVHGTDAHKSRSGTSKTAIGATSLKRSQTFKRDSTIINDLEGYITIKTPRFDPKTKITYGSSYSGVKAPAPTPRTSAMTPCTPISDGVIGNRQAEGTSQSYSGYNVAQDVPETVGVVTAANVRHGTEMLVQIKRCPIVSVPSAEPCSDSVTS